MSLLTTLTPKLGKRAAQEHLLIGARLQINLLPAEIVAARGVKSVKRLLMMAVVGFTLLLVVSIVVAGAMVQTAQNSLTEEQNRTGRLLSEQASYREVTVVLERLDLTKVAYLFSSRTEVPWHNYLGYVSATVPKDVTLSELTVTAASPLAGAPVEADPLLLNGLGSLTFQAISTTLPDATEWSRALSAIPGFADPRVSSFLHENPGSESEPEYVTTVTVQVSDSAGTNRAPEIEGE